jgi:phosphate transport system substrate-binding protein
MEKLVQDMAPARLFRRAAALALALALAPLAAAGMAAVAGANDDVPPELLAESRNNQAARPRMMVVGSEAMSPFIAAIATRLTAQWQVPEPDTKLAGTHAGFVEFCGGIGGEYPDVVAASRRMRQVEFNECIKHGIADVIEVPIGYSALVFVIKRGDPAFDVTPKIIYTALAAEVPRGDELLVNVNQRWRQLDRKLPDTEIRMLMPDRTSGLRNFFDDVFMQGGCRKFSIIKLTFDAGDRVKLCTTKRTDGKITEIPGQYDEILPKKMLEMPSGTIGILPHYTAIQHPDKLQILSVEGVFPSPETIRHDDYEGAHALYFYFKRAHMRNAAGVGVVRGLRQFIVEASGEAARAPGGYLERLGLVALPEEDRQEQRRAALRLERLNR